MLKNIGILLALALILPFAIWLAIYKYSDCRKVGHTVLYCIMDLS